MRTISEAITETVTDPRLAAEILDVFVLELYIDIDGTFDEELVHLAAALS